MRMFFDIETQVNKDMIPLMPEPTAPGNLKDPEKISAAIAEKKAEQIINAPLDPDYGRILTISWATSSTINAYKTLVSTDDESEIYALNQFWIAFAACGAQCVGYNIIGFDLPHIMRRSMALKVRATSLPFLAKFRSEPVTDLMGILYNWGPAKGLKTVAKLYGIPVAVEGVTGADVANLAPEKVAEYCESDVKLVQDLYNRMNGIYFKH